jgi:hypothetical protein
MTRLLIELIGLQDFLETAGLDVKAKRRFCQLWCHLPCSLRAADWRARHHWLNPLGHLRLACSVLLFITLAALLVRSGETCVLKPLFDKRVRMAYFDLSTCSDKRPENNTVSIVVLTIVITMLTCCPTTWSKSKRSTSEA